MMRSNCYENIQCSREEETRRSRDKKKGAKCSCEIQPAKRSKNRIQGKVYGRGEKRPSSEGVPKTGEKKCPKEEAEQASIRKKRRN
jgi:hypothetical protein